MGVEFIGKYPHNRQNLYLRTCFWPKYSLSCATSLKVSIFFVYSLQEPVLMYKLKYKLKVFRCR